MAAETLRKLLDFDSRRMVLAACGVCVVLAGLVQAPSPIPWWTNICWGLVMFLAAMFKPHGEARINRGAAILASCCSVAVLAWQTMLHGGGPLTMPGTVLMLLPGLFLTIVPDDAIVAVVTAAAASLGMYLVCQLPGVSEEIQTAALATTVIVGVTASCSAWMHARTRRQELERERERSRALALSEQRRSQLEEQAVAGRLAADVGHDINNPLAYISTNLVVLRELCKTMRDELEQAGIPCRSLGVDLQEIEEIMADCEDGVQRIAGIVDDLGRVFRGRESGSCAVRVVVDAAARMASNEIRHRAIFSAEISGEPLVCISESKLIQILLNILVNAAHAITPGSIDRNRITLQSWEEGEWVVLRISDTGSGMTEEVKARLFEPLFTTKPEGIGTGLGMSIVDRILKESGGRISLTSAPGQGTTFTIHLPNAEAILEEDDLETDSLHGAARVLIIDDEVRVTRALRRLMRQLCAVTEAHGAEDALRLIRGGARFDVILCDLMMPETSGEELLQLLQAEAPEQAERLVFMTGGAFTEQARDFIDETPRPVLKKPLTPRQIRDVIAGRHAQLGAERY